MQEILELFVEKTGMRKWMALPFSNSEQNVMFATDGSAMVVINGSNYYENHEEKIKGIYPLETENRNIPISFDSLNDTLAKIKPTNKKTCPDCDGTGEVEWQYKDYTEEFECPVCLGTGTIHTSNTSFNEEAGVKINGSIFYSKQIKRILDTMKLCGSKELVIISTVAQMTVFRISNDILVFQMETTLKDFEVELPLFL